MQKFEELLKQMYWVSATVHLETELSGKHTFNWEPSTVGCHVPNSGELRVKCEWEREAAFLKQLADNLSPHYNFLPLILNSPNTKIFSKL